MNAAYILNLAGAERRRALTLPPGIYRDDAKGWARDLIEHARWERLK